MAISSLSVSTSSMQGQKVLVADDEPMVREVVSAYLDREGFKVFEAGTGHEALDVISREAPNLVVLDVMLPNVDGLSILKELRRESELPVILLTARNHESDRILGLELGADDYVVKPFSPRELVARVRTVLKRVGKNDLTYERHQFGDLVVDGRAREVFVGERRVELTPKEFELLEYFCGSPRQVLTRGQLLEQVWDSSTEWQDPATVTVHVRRIRNKIESDAESPRWIKTVWGVGYRFEP